MGKCSVCGKPTEGSRRTCSPEHRKLACSIGGKKGGKKTARNHEHHILVGKAAWEKQNGA